MCKAVKKIQHYQSALGLLGVLAFLITKITGRQFLFKKKLAGIEHPVLIRIGTTDVSVFKQVFIERHYELPLSLSPKVIVDAGANIGLSAVYFANKYPSARIYAIEPEGSNYALLKINTSIYSNIIPLNVALWKENGEICLIDPGGGHHAFQTVEGQTDNIEKVRFIKAMTMKTIMSDMHIDFIDILKIDIEGAEREVFENSLDWIEKVSVIMAELHDHIATGATRTFLQATVDFDSRSSRGETVACFRSK